MKPVKVKGCINTYDKCRVTVAVELTEQEKKDAYLYYVSRKQFYDDEMENPCISYDEKNALSTEALAVVTFTKEYKFTCDFELLVKYGDSNPLSAGNHDFLLEITPEFVADCVKLAEEYVQELPEKYRQKEHPVNYEEHEGERMSNTNFKVILQAKRDVHEVLEKLEKEGAHTTIGDKPTSLEDALSKRVPVSIYVRNRMISWSFDVSLYDVEDVRTASEFLGKKPQIVSETLSQADRCELWGRLVDVVEDFLESKGIEIPNDEKTGEEREAIIFGSDYDALADGFAQALGIDRDNIEELEGDVER